MLRVPYWPGAALFTLSQRASGELVPMLGKLGAAGWGRLLIAQQLVDLGLGPGLCVHRLDDYRAGE